MLHPQPAGLQPPTGARGDLLFSLEGQQCVGGVSVIHPGASTYCAVAAKTDGGAATRWDADKTALNRGYGVGCYRFVPLTVETFGRLGKPLMKLITDVSDQGHSARQRHFHSRVICHWCTSRALSLLVPP
jgi:hypothetical protein